MGDDKTATRSLDLIYKSDTNSLRCAEPQLWQGIPTRCRRCAPCRAFARWKIRKKLTFESACARRVWFVTLILENHADYSAVQLWLKQVRKAADKVGSSVRFFCAEEFGERKGRKYWHVLLFFNKPVPRRALSEKVGQKRRWSHGFHDWKLATNPARYVSKSLGYVAKGGKYRALIWLGAADGSPELCSLVSQVRDSFPDAKVRRVDGKVPWQGKRGPGGPVPISPQRQKEISDIHAEAQTCEGRERGDQWTRLVVPLAIEPRTLRKRAE